jgi:hypothetical protein
MAAAEGKVSGSAYSSLHERVLKTGISLQKCLFDPQVVDLSGYKWMTARQAYNILPE